VIKPLKYLVAFVIVSQTIWCFSPARISRGSHWGDAPLTRADDNWLVKAGSESTSVLNAQTFAVVRPAGGATLVPVGSGPSNSAGGTEKTKTGQSNGFGALGRKENATPVQGEGHAGEGGSQVVTLRGVPEHPPPRSVFALDGVTVSNPFKEQIMVGKCMEQIGLAGQIWRRVVEHDWGIDGEIEFTNSQGRPSGKKIYLQLKAGDSHLRVGRNGAEVFPIKNASHSEFWRSQVFPVILVVLTSDGVMPWTELTSALRERPRARSLRFEGRRFDAREVKRLKSLLLKDA
jgi:hypothetical protein